MSDRREEILDQALDHVLQHGLAGLSLRPLAEAIGTSARLLVYHFGSKEGLITALLEALQARAQKAFAAEDARRSPAGEHVMLAFWKRLTRPSNLPTLRLMFEVQVLALQYPEVYGSTLEGASSAWLDLIEAALPPGEDRRATATLCASVMDGLLLEFLSTGDRARTTLALERFTVLLREPAPLERG